MTDKKTSAFKDDYVALLEKFRDAALAVIEYGGGVVENYAYSETRVTYESDGYLGDGTVALGYANGPDVLRVGVRPIAARVAAHKIAEEFKAKAKKTSAQDFEDKV